MLERLAEGSSRTEKSSGGLAACPRLDEGEGGEVLEVGEREAFKEGVEGVAVVLGLVSREAELASHNSSDDPLDEELSR